MSHIAILEGASPLGQKLSQKLLAEGHKVLCVDDLTQNPSPVAGALLKRSVLEVGPLELAFKKEKIDQIYFLPRKLQTNLLIEQIEFQVNALIGILKVAEKVPCHSVKVYATADLHQESLQHYEQILKTAKLKSETTLELVTDLAASL